MRIDDLPESTQRFVRQRSESAGITPEEFLLHFENISRGRRVSKHSLFSGTPGEVISFNGGCLNTTPFKVWATAKSIRETVADIPEHTLAEFALNHPEDVRKYGESRNSTLVFRTAAVIKFIEELKEAK